jgi:hypothetical protein
LQAIQEYKPQDVRIKDQPPSSSSISSSSGGNTVLVKWLQRLQFKMGQIEMQASNVTQFFIV